MFGIGASELIVFALFTLFWIAVIGVLLAAAIRILRSKRRD